ncbi:MAG: hypothetical protein Q4G07_08615 [Oscillospiraceae bacterium]|nr:hypothetical protein [Oscillospiraceae bacterium]
MTARQICRLAMGILSQTEEESEELMEFSPGWLTILCAESLGTENRIRRQRGEPVLNAPPLIGKADMDKELGYSEELCRIALAYGMAAFYYADDDNDYRAADYRARYVNALQEAEKAGFENIEDVYGEG